MDIDLGEKVQLFDDEILRFPNDRVKSVSSYLYEKYGDKIGDIFNGALVVYLNEKNPERIFQSAHSLREMLSVLFDKYCEDKKGGEKYKIEKIDKIITTSKKIILTNHYFIHNQDYENIRKLCKNNEPQFQQIKIKKFIFETYETEGNPYLESIANKLLAVFNNLTAISHHPTLRNSLKNNYNAELTKEKEKDFELTLDELINILSEICVKRINFFDNLNEIDNIISKKSFSNENLNRLLLFATTLEQRKYLYAKLNDAEILDRLEKKKVFSVVPRYVTEGEYIKFPDWPEGNYLLNISLIKEKEVFNIVEKLLKESTKFKDVNPRLYTTVLDLAIKSNIIGKYAGLIINYNITRNKFMSYEISEKMTEIIIKCIKSEKIKLAMELSSEVFDVDIEKREVPDMDYTFTDIKPLIDTWHYKFILENISKEIAESRTYFIEMLCSKLNRCLLLENKINKVGRYNDDFSYIWRRTLLGDSHDMDVKDILVSQIINEINNETNKNEVLKILNSYRFVIFLRIKLWLLSQNLNDDNIKNLYLLLKDKHVLNIYSVEKEYRQILTSIFSVFDIQQQKNIIATIIREKIGLLKVIKILIKDKNIKYVNRIKKSIRYSKLQNLHAVSSFLSGKNRSIYDKLYSEFGEPKEIQEMTSWSGPNSPFTLDQLAKMNPAEIFNYLKNWSPDIKGHGPEPSPEGLGRIFEEYIKNHADQFILFAERFFDEKVRLVYLYHFLNGLEGFIKNGGVFEWEPIINLSLKIIRTNNFDDFPKSVEEYEPRDDALEKAVARIIGVGLITDKSYTIDFKYRNNIFEIIKKLSKNNEPDLEYEKKYGGDNMDAYTISINTIRGEAMHSLMKYTYWCSDNEKTKKIPQEAIDIIVERLDPKIDSTLTTRSVIGHYLPQIFSTDKNWVLQNLDLIFSKNNKELYLAVWTHYLSNPIYEFIYDDLYGEYVYSFQFLSNEKEKRFFDFNRLVTQHVALAYIHNFKSSDSLIDNFLDASQENHQIELVGFCGKYTLNIKDNKKYTEDDLREMMDRMKSLLSKILSHNNISTKALQEFGWWLKNDFFEPLWLLNNLDEITGKTQGSIDNLQDVIPFLKEYSTIYPKNVVDVLEKIIVQGRNFKNQWELNLNTIKEVFEGILEIKEIDKSIVLSISKITNILGDAGYSELFRDIYQKSIVIQTNTISPT